MLGAGHYCTVLIADIGLAAVQMVRVPRQVMWQGMWTWTIPAAVIPMALVLPTILSPLSLRLLQ